MQRRIFLLSTPAVLLPGQTSSPAEMVLRKWLEAFNSGDKAKIEAFMKVHEPERLERIDETMEFRSMTGGFELLKIEKSEARRVIAKLKEKNSPTTATFEMEVSDTEPPVVAGLRLEADGPGRGQAPPRVSMPEALKMLEAEAEKRAAEDRFAGAILVAQHGKVLFQRAYGLADRAAKKPNTLDTQFRLGSMNKMFTAVAALQLVQRGKLSLDDTVGKHIKDYPNADVAAKVKLRHLLNHSGGTGDIFGPQFAEKRLQLRTHDDYVKLYGARAPRFEPGSKWEYSNYGMVLAGALIERASGKSYYDFVRESLFAPAGMTSTDSFAENENVPRRSVGYMRKNKEWAPNTDTLPWRGTAAGGGYSTVGDLLRFAEALKKGKILSVALMKEATSVQAPSKRYGFGFGVEDGRFGHGGGAPGMNGDLAVFPESGVVVAALANLDPPAASALSEFFLDRMPEKG